MKKSLAENDLITGKLPNRDATFFKASPQGSFLMEATKGIIERPTDENIRQADERDIDETRSTQKRTNICAA